MKVTKKRYTVLIISLLIGIVLFVAGCSGGGTATAKTGDKVKVDYTLKLSDGTVYDTSVGKTPFEFTLGQNEAIAGFDKAVIGMKVGETKTVTIPAAEAYGPHLDSLLVTVDRSTIPDGAELQVGQELQATQADGTTVTYPIVKADDKTVTVDTNNPLAGKDLTFVIKLLEIEK
jgi:peptidylprolyl isomerase